LTRHTYAIIKKNIQKYKQKASVAQKYTIAIKFGAPLNFEKKFQSTLFIDMYASLYCSNYKFYSSVRSNIKIFNKIFNKIIIFVNNCVFI